MNKAQQVKNLEDTAKKKLHARLLIAMEALVLLQVETIASVCACQKSAYLTQMFNFQAYLILQLAILEHPLACQVLVCTISH